MDHFLTEVELGDPCSLTIIALIVIGVGRRMVSDMPVLHAWGLHLAAVTFVAFFVYQLICHPLADAAGALGFALRSLIAAALALGATWVTLPVVGYVYQAAIRYPREKLQQWAATLREQSAMRKAQQAAEEQRRREQARAQQATSEKERQAQERRRHEEAKEAKEQEEKRQADATRRAAQEAVRQHVREFYQGHSSVLAEVYPPAMLDAFISAEMHDGLEPTQLWGVCQKKIAELHPLVIQAHDLQRKQEERQAARAIRLKRIDAEIALCRQKMQRLEHVSEEDLDRDSVDDELLGLERRIRELEEQRDLFLMKNEEDNP